MSDPTPAPQVRDGWSAPERLGEGKGVGWIVRLGDTKADIVLYDGGPLLVTDTSEDQAGFDTEDCRPALAALLRASGYPLRVHESRKVVQVEWVKAGDRLPSGDRNERDMTLIGVDGFVNGVGAGDSVAYIRAAPPAPGGGADD